MDGWILLPRGMRVEKQFLPRKNDASGVLWSVCSCLVQQCSEYFMNDLSLCFLLSQAALSVWVAFAKMCRSPCPAAKRFSWFEILLFWNIWNIQLLKYVIFLVSIFWESLIPTTYQVAERQMVEFGFYSEDGKMKPIGKQSYYGFVLQKNTKSVW